MTTICAKLKVPKVKRVDKKQLRMGVRVEKEHTKNPKVARVIALAHLRENKRYYDYLNGMEKAMDKGVNVKSYKKCLEKVISKKCLSCGERISDWVFKEYNGRCRSCAVGVGDAKITNREMAKCKCKEDY